MVFASHSHPLRSRGVVLIIVVMGMIGWWVATSSSQVEDLPVAVPTPTASVWLSCSTLLPSHQPVRLRLGTIAAVESGELTLRTAPLPGETGDALRVELTANTPVVEVRVPSYLGEGRRQVLEEGGQVIERVTVPLSSLRSGQEITLISATDTYCQASVVSERLEYEVMINTEKEL